MRGDGDAGAGRSRTDLRVGWTDEEAAVLKVLSPPFALRASRKSSLTVGVEGEGRSLLAAFDLLDSIDGALLAGLVKKARSRCFLGMRRAPTNSRVQRKEEV